MEPQILDIRRDQAKLLAGRQRFAQRRYIAAGENILRDPGIGCTGAIGTADSMQQRDPVIGKPLPQHIEEFLVMGNADMLEHAHRDNPVETAGNLAIIFQAESGEIGKSGSLGALLGDPVLFP